MSLNEKFGRGSSKIRKVNVHHEPEIEFLRTLLGELSNSTTESQCDVSWPDGHNVYTLTLNHSRQSARASWKLYSGRGAQPALIWAHDTNDVVTVRKLVSEAIRKQAKPSESYLSLSALRKPDGVSEERRATGPQSNVSGKLRKLFIGARQDMIAEKHSPSVSGAKQQPVAKQLSSKPAIEFIDMTPGREILQRVLTGQYGVFSYPAFLFFLEREYYTAVENKLPITLIIFRANDTGNTLDVNSFDSPILQEIAKRIKYTQRKTDILAQYLDNKFAVLLPETNAAGAKLFVKRIEKALLLMPGLTDIKFTFGLATAAGHCNTLPSFISYAENAFENAQELGKDLVCDDEIFAEGNSKELESKPVDLSPARQLIGQLVSGGIFTYPAFLAFLEHEYYISARKERDLLILLLKVRVKEETFDEDINKLEVPAFYEVMRRIGTSLNKRDIFAHYEKNNFVIMRPNASVAQMESLADKLIQSIKNEEWLPPDYPIDSLCLRSEICIARAHPTAANLFCLVPAN